MGTSYNPSDFARPLGGEPGRRMRSILHLLRHDERLAVLSREHPVRLFIADAALGSSVEAQISAQTVRDVRQVNQGSGDRPLLDRSVQVGVLAAAHGLDEVGPV